MGVNQSAGCRVYIGSTDSLTTLTQYQSDSWTEINDVEDLGEFGDESAAVTFTSLKDSRTQKFKGPRDAGTMAVVCGDEPLDPGQHLAVVAETTKFDYNFKVELADALTLGGANSIHYFHAKVMSARRTVGNASNIVKRNFNLGINSAIVSSNPT